MQVTCLSPTSAWVSWKPPDDNRAGITEYVLECATVQGNSPRSLFNVQYRGRACEALCNKLQRSTDYHFRLAAYNKVGGCCGAIVITTESAFARVVIKSHDKELY